LDGLGATTLVTCWDEVRAEESPKAATRLDIIICASEFFGFKLRGVTQVVHATTIHALLLYFL
jgi:hypothetical protein